MYDPNIIVTAIERLAQAAEVEDDMIKVWVVATLAARFDVTTAIGTGEDPVEAVYEIGESWSDMTEELLLERPDRRGDTLRAALEVVQRLLGAVGPRAKHRSTTRA